MFNRRFSVIALAAVAGALAAAPALGQVPTPPPLPPLAPPGQQPPGQQPPNQQPSPSQQQPPGQERPPQGPPPPAPGPVSAAPGSITVDVDVGHTGTLADEDLVPPLVARWTVPGAGQVLAADGRVYLVDTALRALDPLTGATRWTAQLPGAPRGAAYDGGAVFVSTPDDLHAYDAATGAHKWTRHLRETAIAAAPVASGGVVYVTYGQGARALAFRGSDGAPLWSEPTLAGSGAPALDGERLYVAGACGSAQALDRQTGKEVWAHRTGCTGGPSLTAVLSGGRLWSPETERTAGGSLPPPIFDARSGAVVGRGTDEPPVVVDGLAISRSAKSLVGVEVATGRRVWSVSTPMTAEIAVGHDVYGFRGGRLTALGAADGRQLWQEPGPLRFSPNAVTRVGAAPGLLITVRGGEVTAWESVLRPPPRGVATFVTRADVVAGGSTTLVGVAGREVRTEATPVTIQGAAVRRRARFGRILRMAAARDGGFAARVRPRRNVRLRAAAGGVASPPRTVYVEPRVKLGEPRAASRRLLRLGVGVRTPGANLGGRRFVLYLARAKARRLERVASGTLRRSGRGRARTTLTFAPLRGARRGDLLTFCVRGQLRLGLGRPSPLNRRCGARRLPS